MNQAKRFLIAAVGAVGLTGAGVSLTQAAANPHPGDTRMATLVQALAKKFNLNATDIQAVFDENRQAMEANRLQEAKARLEQAVKDGKLTQAQADQIVAKQQELKTVMESLKGKTREEAEAARKTAMDNLKTWAASNNIPHEYLNPGFGHGGPGGPGRGGMRDPKELLTQAVTDGKLTQAQADLITAKQAEIKTFLDGLKDKTPAERAAAVTAQVATWKAWATSNGIPDGFFRLPEARGDMGMMGQGGPRGGRGGFRGQGGRGGRF